MIVQWPCVLFAKFKKFRLHYQKYVHIIPNTIHASLIELLYFRLSLKAGNGTGNGTSNTKKQEREIPESLKTGRRKAGFFKYRNMKSRNLSKKELEKPESFKTGRRKAGIFQKRNSKSRNLSKKEQLEKPESFKTGRRKAGIFQKRNSKSRNLSKQEREKLES